MLLQAVNFTGYRLIRRKIEKRPLLLDVHTCIAKKLPPVKPE